MVTQSYLFVYIYKFKHKKCYLIRFRYCNIGNLIIKYEFIYKTLIKTYPHHYITIHNVIYSVLNRLLVVNTITFCISM